MKSYSYPKIRNLVWLFALCFALGGASPGYAETQEMEAANSAASKLLGERMKKDRPKDLSILRTVRSAEVVAVRGVYDHVETVLGAVQVPHLVIDPADLDHIELNAGQLLLINCPGELSRTALAKVEKFVRSGGFLFTTDWSLQNVLEKAFPGYVAFNQKPTGDDVVAVRVLKSDNNFLQHVSTGKDSPKWWLEGSSYPIRILNKAKVEVLMESDEMKRKYGESPIAVHFRHGDGQVLHIVSHYYLQRTETRTTAEKAVGTEFSKSIGVMASPEATEELKKTTAGAVRDAYAAQQLSVNVIVGKQKQNKELEKIYAYLAEENAILRSGPANGSSKLADLKQGTPLKVIEQKGDWLKVQTFSGDVGWIRSVSAKKR